MRYIMFCLILLTGHVSAHEWTPTYPKLEQSFVAGVLQVKMRLFNKRADVDFYTFEVLDKEYNHVKFAVNERVTRIDYLEKKEIVIYIRDQDVGRARYICSRSKLLLRNDTATLVSSRICSKIK